MRKIRNHLAALTFAAVLMTTSSFTACAEESVDTMRYDYDSYSEEDFIVEYFDDNEYVFDGSCFSVYSAGISPYSVDSIPQQYWGAYNSSDGNSYLQIHSGTQVTFKGNFTGGYILCNYSNVQSIYFQPAQLTGENFHVDYSEYTSINLDSNGNVISTTRIKKPVTLLGHYNMYNRTFTIYGIAYTKA